MSAKGAKTFRTHTVGVTATEILHGNSHRASAIIYNGSANTIYLGPAGVTVLNGFPLAAGAYLTDEDSVDEWFGVAAANSSVSSIEVIGA